jgi:universal stress protein E
MLCIHKQRLEAFVDQLAKWIKIETKVYVGIPFLKVIRDIVQNGRDIVIVVPEDQDWLARLFDSDDMHILPKCLCPVW